MVLVQVRLVTHNHNVFYVLEEFSRFFRFTAEKNSTVVANILKRTKMMAKVNPVHTRKANRLQNAGCTHKQESGLSARISRKENTITKR